MLVCFLYCQSLILCAEVDLSKGRGKYDDGRCAGFGLNSEHSEVAPQVGRGYPSMWRYIRRSCHTCYKEVDKSVKSYILVCTYFSKLPGVVAQTEVPVYRGYYRF